jgi:glyoxylase-like metal-dependent hydrolase (beta-lactamase superfamily II)
MLKEILPDLYSWSQYSEEKKLDFNGYLIIGKDESIIIDPPDLENDDEASLKSIIDQHVSCPLKGILLTNVHHERASDSLRNRFSVPVWVNERDKNGLEVSSNNSFNGEDHLFCDIQAIQLDHQKSPGETAFYMRDKKMMIVGDALIGKAPGQLSMLPPDKYQDAVKAKAGLGKLMNYEFDTLLVGDGVSILKGAKQAVATFLAS